MYIQHLTYSDFRGSSLIPFFNFDGERVGSHFPCFLHIKKKSKVHKHHLPA